MDFVGQSVPGSESYVHDARQKPRFRLDVPIRIYPRNRSVVYGHTVDLSESGIAAMLREEIPIGELVRLEFTVSLGAVEILALVRQRNAFRYGFQFVEPATPSDRIGQTCRQLAIEQLLFAPKLP